jgi:hypothetical protein
MKKLLGIVVLGLLWCNKGGVLKKKEARFKAYGTCVREFESLWPHQNLI